MKIKSSMCGYKHAGQVLEKLTCSFRQGMNSLVYHGPYESLLLLQLKKK